MFACKIVPTKTTVIPTCESPADTEMLFLPSMMTGVRPSVESWFINGSPRP